MRNISRPPVSRLYGISSLYLISRSRYAAQRAFGATRPAEFICLFFFFQNLSLQVLVMILENHLSRLHALLDSNFGLAFLLYKHQQLFRVLLGRPTSLVIVAMYILHLYQIDAQKVDIPNLLLTQRSKSHLNIQEYTSMPYKNFIPIGGRVGRVLVSPVSRPHTCKFNLLCYRWVSIRPSKCTRSYSTSGFSLFYFICNLPRKRTYVA